MTTTCGACRFYQDGRCHAAPPVVLPDGQSRRPAVAADDPACGVYQLSAAAFWGARAARPEAAPAAAPVGKGWRRGRTGRQWLIDQGRLEEVR